MVEEPNRYAILGGEAGYQRLLLLSRERAADTAALFDRAGLGPGMRCIDIGCGGGEVTFEIARRVGPTGSVVGIDLDTVKLDLASRAARERGVLNAQFRRVRVEEWDEPNAYDVCFSRFLLQHLAEPVELLRRMWAALRTPGLLIVEDVDWEGWSSDPPNSGLDFMREKYIQVLESRGCDPRIGRRLRRLCLELGIPDPAVVVLNPVHLKGEGKLLAPSTLETTAAAILSAGLATVNEVLAAQKSLEHLVQDPNSLITSPKIFQVVARKAATDG